MKKQTPDGFALVLANRRREPRMGIESAVFLARRVVQEVPNVKEPILGHAATGTALLVKEARKFTAKLKGVASVNFGGHVLERVKSTGSGCCRRSVQKNLG